MNPPTLRYHEAIRRLQQARRDAAEVARDAFHEVAQEFFNAHPDVESFSWTQYTPYFNDGQPCEFEVHRDIDYSLQVNGVSLEDAEGYPDADDFRDGTHIQGMLGVKYPNTDWDAYRKAVKEWTPPAYPAVADLLGEFDDEDLKELFGDHVQVTVRRSGVQVEEYDHD